MNDKTTGEVARTPRTPVIETESSGSARTTAVRQITTMRSNVKEDGGRDAAGGIMAIEAVTAMTRKTTTAVEAQRARTARDEKIKRMLTR